MLGYMKPVCESGLHASREPFDALQYAPGDTLCYMRCEDEIIELVCSRRTIIARMDAEKMLRYYARMQALSVVHLWDAPDVVLDYLMTGDNRAAVYADAAYACRGMFRGSNRGTIMTLVHTILERAKHIARSAITKGKT